MRWWSCPSFLLRERAGTACAEGRTGQGRACDSRLLQGHFHQRPSQGCLPPGRRISSKAAGSRQSLLGSGRAGEHCRFNIPAVTSCPARSIPRGGSGTSSMPGQVDLVRRQDGPTCESIPSNREVARARLVLVAIRVTDAIPTETVAIPLVLPRTIWGQHGSVERVSRVFRPSEWRPAAPRPRAEPKGHSPDQRGLDVAVLADPGKPDRWRCR